MNSLKLVIFDCDGVLFDSREANRHYYNDLLLRFGHPVMNEEEVEYVHMHNVQDSVRHIFRNFPADIEKANGYRVELDYRPYLLHMKMEPDLPQFLDFLRPNFRTAISTNRTTTMPEVLRVHGLEGRFEMVVTALDVNRPKPHPEALEKILFHFDLHVEQAVYIGDSIIDRQHTEAIGMRLIAFKNQKLPADFHANSFTEVMKLPLFS
ncbi:MAG: HAD hydrolase-like protein [Deltaproteobacteria bacterium]